MQPSGMFYPRGYREQMQWQLLAELSRAKRAQRSTMGNKIWSRTQFEAP